MDGTLAVIWLLTSLGDMRINECPTGCVARQDAPARLSIQVAEVIFQEEEIGQEIYVGYDASVRYGPFQPTYGASLTDEGAVWIGAGAKWTTRNLSSGPFFIETSFMPGFYARGDGPDLGGALHFRSALGAGYIFDNGATLTISYDHRSNGDIQSFNPGLETLSLRYAYSWK
ncbi:acyloxyacyl hydrolase [Cognatiyoonia sp. IB215446]|uniref:acyloxyacyl hydrolase n=1 Tax=Cognatiyoonia sp. IB215446 TaxID=3097355 RepID=UPI002A10E0B1|nr:acyloxyacyl hydrolase [Cognatiyoonia sp. IB215446]MDX8348668.1 acyloxyacyl hydrolase [Cognatiyoonia sp. IB215446]